MKSYIFDVEMIIDHEMTTIRGEIVGFCTHRVIRCLNIRELNDLIKTIKYTMVRVIELH